MNEQTYLENAEWKSMEFEILRKKNSTVVCTFV